jgi:Mrp family chromosome partitioning ATPase
MQEKVLVIDTDFSVCRMHQMCSVKNLYKMALLGDSMKTIQGLDEYLRGHCNLEDITYKTEVSNLFFIPAGLNASASSQLLHSTEMKNLMRRLVDQYDRVILDGGPFGSDTLALAKMVDAVVLIASIGGTRREAIKIFRHNISNIGANMLGIVVNKVNPSRYSSDYYSHYYRSYKKSASALEA